MVSPGSFDTAHSLRDGTFWDSAGKPEDTGETYDLIIVGGGISGLAAAHFYRKATGGKGRILILENHDDFGGHAKRNEFHVGDRFMLGFGGTYSIQSPAPYSKVAKGVIEELGIDVESYPKYVDKDLYRSHGLASKIFFDKETFGADALTVNPRLPRLSDSDDPAFVESDRWKKFVAEALDKRPDKTGPIVASLNCTHYGYVKPLWEQAFAAAGYPGVKVLDPNPLMTDLVLKEGGAKRFPSTAVTVEVVSKVPIDEATRANLGALLRTVSPQTADALGAYRRDPGLFPANVDPAAVLH